MPAMNKSSPSTPDLSDTIFGRLWLARDVAAIGDWVLFVGLMTYASKFSESPAVFGQLVTIVLAPRFLLWPVLSRVVTWRNARAFGITAQLMQATILLPAFLVDITDGARPVLIIAFAYSVARPFVVAAHNALFPVVTARARRREAREALLNTWLLTLAIGPAFGVFIFGAAALPGAAIATLVAALISAGALFFSRPAAPGDEPVNEVPEFISGLSPLPVVLLGALWSPRLRQIAIIQVLATLLAGGLLVLEAAYSTNGLYVGMESFGTLVASQGVGIALSGLWYQRYARQQFAHSALVSTGLVLLGGGELGLSISSTLPAGIGLTAAIGFGVGLLLFSFSDLGEETMVEERASARSWLSVRTLVDAALVLSAAVAAPLCQSISPRFTVVLSGILVCVLALYSFGDLPDSLPNRQAEKQPNH